MHEQVKKMMQQSNDRYKKKKDLKRRSNFFLERRVGNGTYEEGKISYGYLYQDEVQKGGTM